MLDFSTLGGLIGLHRQGRLSDDGYKQLSKLLIQENERLYAKLGRAEKHAREVSTQEADPKQLGSAPVVHMQGRNEAARELLEMLEE